MVYNPRPIAMHGEGTKIFERGWLCPRCEKINSPRLMQCMCEPDEPEEEKSHITYDDFGKPLWGLASQDDRNRKYGTDKVQSYWKGEHP